MIIEPWHSNILSADDSQNMFLILAGGKSEMNVACCNSHKDLEPHKNFRGGSANKKGDIVMLRPLGANVVVKADAVEEKTKSGIFIPDTASKEKPMQGTVLAVGNGAIVDGKRIPIDVKVGDSVVFAKYCGTQIKLNGEELLILAERDILAVVEPDKKKK